nr:hypothetical protein TorRG33x02_034050 [Ipomoea trifida]
MGKNSPEHEWGRDRDDPSPCFALEEIELFLETCRAQDESGDAEAAAATVAVATRHVVLELSFESEENLRADFEVEATKNRFHYINWKASPPLTVFCSGPESHIAVANAVGAELHESSSGVLLDSCGSQLDGINQDGDPSFLTDCYSPGVNGGEIGQDSNRFVNQRGCRVHQLYEVLYRTCLHNSSLVFVKYAEKRGSSVFFSLGGACLKDMNQWFDCISVCNCILVVVVNRQIEDCCDSIFLDYRVFRMQQANQHTDSTGIGNHDTIVHVKLGKEPKLSCCISLHIN